MRELTATNNLTTSSWEFTESGESDYNITVHFSFTNGSPFVTFVDLNFGYSLVQQEKVIRSASYPTPGASYIGTDQLYLESFTENLVPEESYSLSVWSKENGVEATALYNFTTGRPPAPYPSWTWNNMRWNPPKERPTAIDGSIYVWDESLLDWKVMSELIDTSGYDVE